MADETKSITSKGLGFFNTSGTLKTKEELKAESSKPQNTEKTSQSVSTNFSDRITDALSKVESRFVERANKAIEVTTSSEKSIKEARDVTTREIAAAKDLKKAIKNGNAEKADAARESLAELQKEREALAAKIDTSNRDASSSRKQSLSLGNSEKASVTVNPVRFEARKDSNPAQLQNEDEVEVFIKARQAEKKELRAQAQDLKEVKKQIKESIKTTRDEVSSIRKDSITTFEKAEEVTQKVASDIRAGGISLVENSISQNLSSEAIQALIDP